MFREQCGFEIERMHEFAPGTNAQPDA